MAPSLYNDGQDEQLYFPAKSFLASHKAHEKQFPSGSQQVEYSKHFIATAFDVLVPNKVLKHR